MLSCRVYYATVHASDSNDRCEKQSVQRMLSLAEHRKIDLEVSHNADCKIDLQSISVSLSLFDWKTADSLVSHISPLHYHRAEEQSDHMSQVYVAQWPGSWLPNQIAVWPIR